MVLFEAGWVGTHCVRTPAFLAALQQQGLRKIFEQKMRLAVSRAGRSLEGDRRVLQVSEWLSD